MDTHELHDLVLLHLRARDALLVLVTADEQHTASVVDRVRRARDPRSATIHWDSAAGFEAPRSVVLRPARTAEQALAAIQARIEANPDERDVYLLRDFHQMWQRSPAVTRGLRTVAQVAARSRASIVVTTPTHEVPAELAAEATVLELGLPGTVALREELEELLAANDLVDSLAEPEVALLPTAALGLTRAQARRAFARALVHRGRLDAGAVDSVLGEKRRLIQRAHGLEFHAPSDQPGTEQVGGFDLLKRWVELRGRAFSSEARAYGLPSPRGVALIGVPGSGKSLAARMVAGAWHLPLLRLDLGSVFGSKLGESEERARRALEVAEAIAPCVLWIDELEKALAHGDQDGGTSNRVLATLLTWMQERRSPVFLVATANDVSALPPEVLRRGRFDEVFFLDLPDEQERAQILAVQLRRRGRCPEAFDLNALARGSQGLVGAEIEQAVVDAMFAAFSGGRELDTEDVCAALGTAVPLTRSRRESVARLQAWLRQGRARPASSSSDVAPPTPEPARPDPVPSGTATGDPAACRPADGRDSSRPRPAGGGGACGSDVRAVAHPRVGGEP